MHRYRRYKTRENFLLVDLRRMTWTADRKVILRGLAAVSCSVRSFGKNQSPKNFKVRFHFRLFNSDEASIARKKTQ